jgi:hypothetical protein
MKRSLWMKNFSMDRNDRFAIGICKVWLLPVPIVPAYTQDVNAVHRGAVNNHIAQSKRVFDKCAILAAGWRRRGFSFPGLPWRAFK